MNKILTVGHPQSGYLDVEQILLACGMQQALESKNERLAPVEIGSILCKVHGAVPLEAIGQSREIRQLEAGPVWHGLALDLLMGNIDQPFWGWSDPQAIYLLEYWKSLDPKMVFMLVYDEPHRVLHEMKCDEACHWTYESIDHRLQNWNAYNSALLAFYLRNRDRSMLVNARQVRKTADTYLHLLQSYLDNRLQLSSTGIDNAELKPLDTRNGACKTGATHNGFSLTQGLAVPALADGFLIDGILSGYQEHLQRYEELQASATIPMEDEASRIHKPVDAWLVQMKRRSEAGRALSILFAQKQSVEQELLEGRAVEACLRDELERNGKGRDLLAEENDWLLAELYRVEEKLGHYATEADKLRLIRDEKDRLEQKQLLLGKEIVFLEEKLMAAQQQLETLQTESIGNVSARKAHAEENELLLAQLHQVQEELERHYLENQKNTVLAEENVALEKKRQALEEQCISFEARLKEQQARAVEEKSVLESKQKALEHEKKVLEQKARDLRQQLENLQKESEGNVNARNVLTEENELLLMQLHQVQEELERYYLENQSLRQDAKPAYYGAADRLKLELPYRLGAAMIERSRKVWPVPFLPISLWRIGRAYRMQEQQAAEKLPPLSEYRDYSEAEKAQKHLSYRLGETWLQHSRTPWGWVVMPFALTNARHAYLQHRKSLGTEA